MGKDDGRVSTETHMSGNGGMEKLMAKAHMSGQMATSTKGIGLIS